jgi:hypothetical protein
MLISKCKSLNKTNENENMTHVKQKSSDILYKEKIKIEQCYNKKTYWKLVEQIKGNGEFYLYLYLLGI